MKATCFFLGWVAALAVVLGAGNAAAQAGNGSVTQAFQVARQAVSPDLQTKVVSVYGQGTPTAIEKWYIIFYDPTVPSHGRAALVENGAITKSYVANGGAVYSASLTFDPSRITSEGPALDAAQAYAARHEIKYDSVNVLLKQTSVNRPFRWKVGLIDDHQVKGYVMVNALDDTVASYVPTPVNGGGKTVADSANAAGQSAKEFGSNVKDTFLGIGGDLEQFFTGERTVDK